MGSVYNINKGINRSIEFKGLKAQYIWYLGGGVMVLLILFSLLYILGINTYICLLVILPSGFFMVMKIYALSHKYGEFGMMKRLARGQIPAIVKCSSRAVFFPRKRKPEQRAGS